MSEGTDIQVSPSRRHIIKRPRLTRLLDETKARCILLVAPAGYGKTLVVREWLADDARTGVWYRATAAARDSIALAASVAAALETVVPGSGRRLHAHIRANAAGSIDLSVLTEMLVEQLTDWPSHAWLVIDDYQSLAGATDSEVFIGELVANTAVNIVVTTRRRPSWATTRQVLYGEILEIARSALAMTPEEAGAVLKGSTAESLGGFLALADGWPAVIGLAAHSRSLIAPDSARLPRMLHEYFAQELFAAADATMQRDLCCAAVAARATPALLSACLGHDRLRQVVTEGIGLGFFQPDGADGIRIHPLLRHFLNDKLKEQGPEVSDTTITHVGRVLLEARRWDEVFDITCRFNSPALLMDLISAALHDILESGRIRSLREWIAQAGRLKVEHPILDLARANVALRDRELADASFYAVRAAADPELSARSLVLAGRSAHLSFDEARALDFHRRAEAAAKTAGDVREAVWGQFLSASDLELDEAEEVLARLAENADPTPEAELQIATGHLSLAAHRGNVDERLALAKAAYPLVDHARDPLARTSFLNSFADGLVISADYAAALSVVDRELAEVKTYRLDFARPYAELVGAAARCGLGQYKQASAMARSVRDEFGAADRYVELSSRMIEARALGMGGAVGTALKCLPQLDADGVTPALHGHYLATKSLLLAASDQVTAAENEIGAARAATESVEAHSLANWAEASLALEHGDHADEKLRRALDHVASEGDRNSLVTAYRVVQPLLPRLLDVEGRPHVVEPLARRLGDLELIAIGRGSRSSTRRERLSPREREVADLLLQGLRNREIAHALFISEVTVKAHLRHIYSKLNARSRTQAVVKLRDQADGDYRGL